MKIRSLILTSVTAGCILAVSASTRALAQVSPEDFNSLKKMVEDLGRKVQKLEQTHEQDQQTHQQDQAQIQDLKTRLEETQRTATNAAQKAEMASQIQPIHPVPPAGMNAMHNFTMVGDAEVQFGKTIGQHNGFVMADFAPIFLFRARDNILFEAGFDITLQNGAIPLQNGSTGNSGTQTAVDLSFAQLDYMLNDYITAVAGYMVLPLGTYSERAAGWLNKIPDDPLPRSALPSSGVGAQLRGAMPIGQKGQSLTYAVFAANGPGSVDGSGNATTFDDMGNQIPNLDLGGNVGIHSDGTSGNLHGTPSAGGRIGWFYPLKPHYDLELGVSGQSGTWDNDDHLSWSAVVLDAALHLGPYAEIKGEYIQTWYDTLDIGPVRPRGWWLQAAYKVAGLGLQVPYVNNLEFVGRYDTMNDGFGSNTDRYTLGYVYYITNTLLFEGDYEWLRGNDLHNSFVFQLSYGF